MFQCWPPKKLGDPGPKAHLNIPVQAEGFMRREIEGKQNEEVKEGVEKVSETCRPALRIPTRT